MAILQALFALITKSAGKILNAIFGWAVRALFGRTTPTEQIFFSGLVGAAVAWPLLLVGAAMPKVGAFLLAFIPIPHWVPSWIVRVVWLGLAALVPFSLGLAIASKAPPTGPRESFVKRLLRGFPITVGLAAAFLIMFVSVPLIRFWAMVKKQGSADIPVATDTDAYHQVAALTFAVLNRHGFGLRKSVPGWWVRAPTRILSWFGGDALRAFVPQTLEYFDSPSLNVSFYPSGVILRGAPQKTTWAHGLIAEAVVHSQGLQTSEPLAQDLEKQIRRVWRVFDEQPSAHVNSTRLLGRSREISDDLGKLDVGFDDWQILYRQILQLERALRGQTQLLDEKPSPQPEESQMADAKNQPPRTEDANIARVAPQDMASRQRERPLAGVPAGELLKEVTEQVSLLAKKQIELATTELRSDLKAELAMVGGLGVAAVAGLMALAMLLVTGVFVLTLWLPGWQAGLIVTGFMLVVALTAALIGWNKRARSPLRRTRQTLKEDVQWTKERLA
jgi:hypothetical protein